MLDIIANYHYMQFQGKLMNQTWENSKKNLVLGLILAYLAKIWATNFFFSQKNLAPSVPRYYGQLSSCTISEKTDNPILRKLSDGGTNGPTDGRSDFIGRCPTNVERPIITIINSRLQVQRCKQQTTSSKVQTACYKFKSANSRLQVQRYKQQATRSKVQTAVKTCKI